MNSGIGHLADGLDISIIHPDRARGVFPSTAWHCIDLDPAVPFDTNIQHLIRTEGPSARSAGRSFLLIGSDRPRCCSPDRK